MYQRMSCWDWIRKQRQETRSAITTRKANGRNCLIAAQRTTAAFGSCRSVHPQHATQVKNSHNGAELTFLSSVLSGRQNRGDFTVARRLPRAKLCLLDIPLNHSKLLVSLPTQLPEYQYFRVPISLKLPSSCTRFDIASCSWPCVWEIRHIRLRQPTSLRPHRYRWNNDPTAEQPWRHRTGFLFHRLL